VLTGITPLRLADSAVADDSPQADRRCSSMLETCALSLSVENWPLRLRQRNDSASTCGRGRDGHSVASQESGAGGGGVSRAGIAVAVVVHCLGEESGRSARGPPLGVEGLVRETPLPTFVDAGDDPHEP
jgi:hypothetical protein